MAPEIYKAPHQHGTASEWFSVGVTLHEFLTGCRPFPVSKFQMSCAAGKTITSVNFSILKQSDRVSADAKDFIEQLLDISPTSRLGSKNGLEDFKSHNWLIDYDWTSVSKGKSKAPIIPNTNGLIIDIDDLGTQREIRDRSKVVSISDDDHKKFALFRMRDTQPHFSIFICGMTENKSTLSLEVSIQFTSTSNKIVREVLLADAVSYRYRNSLNLLDLPLVYSRLRYRMNLMISAMITLARIIATAKCKKPKLAALVVSTLTYSHQIVGTFVNLQIACLFYM